MPIALKAIVPKKKEVVPDIGGVQTALKSWAIDMSAEMARYPAWMPWKRPPKSGIRKGGKRTGSLGRNWAYELGRTASTLWAIVANRVPYAGRVQGYKGRSAPKNEMQARALAARGWQSISDLAQVVWQRHLPDIRRQFKTRR